MPSIDKILQIICATAGLVFILLTPSVARADIVYSNFGPGYTDSGNTVAVAGGNVGGEYYAVAFTPASNVTFTDALADLLWVSGQKTINAYLLTDNGGLPGASLATLNQTTPITSGIEMFVCSSGCPIMQAGIQYWFELQEADPNTDIGWYLSSVDPANNSNVALGFTFFPSGTWFSPNEAPNAFEIDGQPTPEPGSLLLALTGCLVLVGKARRSKE
jgi:hypothetical protein